MHCVVRISKIAKWGHVLLEYVSSPYQTRYGDVLKHWMSGQSVKRHQEFYKGCHTNIQRLRNWMHGSGHDLVLEDAVRVFYEGKPLYPINKRKKNDLKQSFWCFHEFGSLLDNMEYEVILENQRIKTILNAVYVPRKRAPTRFLNFIMSSIRPLTRRRECVQRWSKHMDFVTLNEIEEDIDSRSMYIDSEIGQDLIRHVVYARQPTHHWTKTRSDIFQRFWKDQNMLDVIVDCSRLNIPCLKEHQDTLRWLRERFWSLTVSYPYKEYEPIQKALQWKWIVKEKNHITFSFVYDYIKDIKDTLQYATFIVGDPDILNTSQRFIMVKDEETKFEVDCRLDSKRHIVETELPKRPPPVMIYRAHQFNIKDWVKMLPSLKKAPSIHVMGRTDQYGYLFSDMITHHTYIERPLSMCCSYEFIYNCNDIESFHVKPSMYCQYMASKTIKQILKPQRIYLFYPKRIRTVKHISENEYTFYEADREEPTNIYNVYDASIIAVRDYIGPTLSTIVMVVDEHTKPFDLYTVRTLAYHKVYYLVQGSYCAREEKQQPRRSLIY